MTNGTDPMPVLSRLGDELESQDTGFTEHTVIGSVPAESKNFLKNAYHRAKTRVVNYLVNKNLYPYLSALQRDVPLFIEQMDPESSGIAQAYTDGGKIVANASVIPKNRYFARLMDSLSRSDSKIAKYLYGKLSRPMENLTETIGHEMTHVYQIKSGLVADVFEATKKYIKERLPEHAKPLAEILACYFFKPPIEGKTEATVAEMKGARTPWEIKKDADDSLYGWYKSIAAESYKKIGMMPSDVYKAHSIGNKGPLMNYVKEFCNLCFS